MIQNGYILLFLMVILAFSLFFILSLISDAGIAKQQISVLHKFIVQDATHAEITLDLFNRQHDWNRTSTKVDSGILVRIAKLEKLATDHRIGNLRGIE